MIRRKFLLVPALHFSGGNCIYAMKLYQKVFSGEILSISYNHEAPDSKLAETDETYNHIMHGEMIICGTRVNMCDVEEEILPNNMFILNLFLNTTEEVTSAFNVLKQEGKIIHELEPRFWSPMYCKLIDRYGVQWQIMVNQGI